MEPRAVQAGNCGSMAHEQKQYLRFVAHHSLTASIAVCGPASAAPHHTPCHQALCTPALILCSSAESLGLAPFTRGVADGSAQGSAQSFAQGSAHYSAQQGKTLRQIQWERHCTTL